MPPILNSNTNIFLAPLSGCTDLSFRLIARELGAEFCFYEMSDSNSLVYASRRKSEDIHQTHPDDAPIAAQLLGSDPEIMFKAAKKILELNGNISFLDINAACPVPKVIKKRSGAYLINAPDALYRMLDKLSAALPLPITVKLRTGFAAPDAERIVRIAQKCEQNGAKTIFVHGRTRTQLYSGEVDHQSIKAIKAGVKIPVIASGNIFSAQKAKEMLELTGCDGVLVARGALGNPWIFRQIKSFLTDGTILANPSLEERVKVLTRHLQYIEKYKSLPLNTKLGFSRKIAVWYLKGFKFAAVLRGKINHAQSFPELYRLINTTTAISSS